MADLPDFLASATIAFVSMEIAVEPEMKCYSGGLGVLAGDFARAAADLGLPMVFVTLASRDGYVRQSIDSQGNQRGESDPWDPADWTTPLEPIVDLSIEGRAVAVRGWFRQIEGAGGASVAVLLLDTDLPQNRPEDRALTGRLYGGDARYRLRQEAVLGIATPRLLARLGVAVRRWHLNEGHAALLPLELVHGGASVEAVRQATVFTTHTPVAAGRDRFDWALTQAVLDPDHLGTLQQVMPEADELDMTKLALRLSCYANAVSKRHRDTARALYPGARIRSVTNGVHAGRWTAPAMAALFDASVPGWRVDSSRLAGIAQLDPAHICKAHASARATLIAEVAARTGIALDPERPILCYARRMTGYKRPTLPIESPDRLRAIAGRYPLTLLFAGKAHPDDPEGQAAIARIGAFAKTCSSDLTIAFIADYGLDLAATLVAGADIWLNLPVPPLEASGTSGMKAALNGGLNVSTPDGWWLEGGREGVNGWTVGRPDSDPREHGGLLLQLLEDQVLPCWYGDGPRWQRMMRDAVASIGAAFGADRAMRDYARDAYRLGEDRPGIGRQAAIGP